MSPRSSRLLRLVLILTAIPMILLWLPVVRGLMDGNTYQWGSSFLRWSYGGSGLGGHYWLVLIQLIFCVSLLYLGWSGAQPPFPWMLILWNLTQTVNAFYNALVFPEDYRLQGDTLGLNVSLAWVGPAYFGTTLLLSVLWLIRRRNNHEAQPLWSRSNKILLSIFLGIIPVQWLLLRIGPPHGTADQFGVLLTIFQWVMLNWALAARSNGSTTNV